MRWPCTMRCSRNTNCRATAICCGRTIPARIDGLVCRNGLILITRGWESRRRSSLRTITGCWEFPCLSPTTTSSRTGSTTAHGSRQVVREPTPCGRISTSPHRSFPGGRVFAPAEKKQVYDQQLRSRLLATAAAAPVQPGPAPPPASPDGAVPISPPPPAGLSASPGTTGSPPVSPGGGAGPVAPIFTHGLPDDPDARGHAIGLGVACLALFLLSPGEKNTPAVAQTDPVSRARPVSDQRRRKAAKPWKPRRPQRRSSRPDARRFTAPDARPWQRARYRQSARPVRWQSCLSRN